MELKFNKTEAMQILRTVCGKYLGTANDHVYLQFILNEIEKKITESEKSPNLEVVHAN